MAPSFDPTAPVYIPDRLCKPRSVIHFAGRAQPTMLLHITMPRIPAHNCRCNNSCVQYTTNPVYIIVHGCITTPACAARSTSTYVCLRHDSC
eukprot:5414533-Pyramimonas_sp.AAC.1